MKSIQLYTAALDNGGVRREAGAVLTVGNGKTQIDADRAKALVDGTSATDKVEAEK